MLRARLKRKILFGKILIHPTESCFGMGCHPKAIFTLNKISKIKKRPKNKSFLLISDNPTKFNNLVNFPANKLNKLQDWPLHTSLLFEKNKTNKNIFLAPNQSKIGCRIPDHKNINCILKNFDFPITSTSANISGKRNISSWRNCKRRFNHRSCIILKDKIGKYKNASKIIDYETKKIIRN
jgi:L-threonylcarbamoyladenylate synthase